MHELVLNGIGGRTIAEAKENLTHSEVLAWALYRDKHGSLNMMRRIEMACAVVALQNNRANGGKADLIDFMPHAERPEISLDEAIETWV